MQNRTVYLVGLSLAVALVVGCKNDDHNHGDGAGAGGKMASVEATTAAGGAGSTPEKPAEPAAAGKTAGSAGTAGASTVTAGSSGGAAGASTATGGNSSGSGGTAAGSDGSAAGTGGANAGAGAGGVSAGTGGVAATTPAAMCIANAMAMGRTGACTECGCNKCLDKITACEDEACAKIVACGQMSKCKGRQCYCGTAALVDCASAPNGPCREVIEEASGLVASGMCQPNGCARFLAMLPADNPVGRASAVSVCTRGQDADPGVPPIVPATEAIAGMCEAECAN